MFFKKKFSWDTIVKEYSKNPRDVKTVPLKTDGRWFFVSVQDRDVYITNAKNHSVSSKISQPRKLDKENFNTMLSLYNKRKKGEPVSKTAANTTQNQVYWYGIFADMGI